MVLPSLRVAIVQGRYPHGAPPLKSKNIQAHVHVLEGGYRIRLDDAAHSDMWLEIELAVADGASTASAPWQAQEV